MIIQDGGHTYFIVDKYTDKEGNRIWIGIDGVSRSVHHINTSKFQRNEKVEILE